MRNERQTCCTAEAKGLGQNHAGMLDCGFNSWESGSSDGLQRLACTTGSGLSAGRGAAADRPKQNDSRALTAGEAIAAWLEPSVKDSKSETIAA